MADTDELWLDFDATRPISVPPHNCRLCKVPTSAKAVCPHCGAHSPRSRRQPLSPWAAMWLDWGWGAVLVIAIALLVFAIGVLSTGGVR